MARNHDGLARVPPTPSAVSPRKRLRAGGTAYWARWRADRRAWRGGRNVDAVDDPYRVNMRAHLIFDHIGQRANDQQIQALLQVLIRGAVRTESGETGIFALCEGRLDAGAGVIQHAHTCPHMNACDKPLCCTRQIKLDHFRRA